jgi:benzodiazapine receptor
MKLTYRQSADTALQLYYAQLALNLVWTPLFFGARQKELALANIVALTGTVGAMTVSAVNPTNSAPRADVQAKMHYLPTAFSTSWFLAPYCAWLGYGELGKRGRG